MSFIYISHGFTIHPHHQIIKQGDNTIPVRPKTFALLLLLLENPCEVLSKRYLLDTIWDDVSVDEPVLVQSIRELRQLFGSAEVIQTWPRKGYAWASSVQKQDLPVTSLSPAPWYSRRKLVYALPVAALMLLMVMVYTFIASDTPTPANTGVVIVLPVKNNIPGDDHSWVALGAMDQLINSLVSDRQVQVMNTEYVLELMQHANMPRDYETSQIARIFEISGATLIVESLLSGTVEDYRIDYKLLSRNETRRGVIFSTRLNDLLQKLGTTIATQTGQSLNIIDPDSPSAFNNELMARALEKMDTGELEVARNLLGSLKLLEPNKVMVRQLLGGLLITLGAHDQAITEIKAALDIATASEAARLLFLLALANTEQGASSEALFILEQAVHQAEQNSDILYLAYAAQLRGRIQQRQGFYEAAEKSLEAAISFHALVRCPIGVSLTHLQLIQLFSSQGKFARAESHYAETKRLVEAHRLTHLLPELELAKLTLQQH